MICTVSCAVRYFVVNVSLMSFDLNTCKDKYKVTCDFIFLQMMMMMMFFG